MVDWVLGGGGCMPCRSRRAREQDGASVTVAGTVAAQLLSTLGHGLPPKRQNQGRW